MNLSRLLESELDAITLDSGRSADERLDAYAELSRRKRRRDRGRPSEVIGAMGQSENLTSPAPAEPPEGPT